MNNESNESKASTPSPDAILSDPATIARIASMLGALQPTAPPSKDTAVATPHAEGVPPVAGDGLAALLSNPAMPEMLPRLISMMKPLLAANPSPAVPTVAPQAPSHASNRDNLLLAIKPFLSQNRREAVDTLLRLEKLGEVFNHIKSP